MAKKKLENEYSFNFDATAFTKQMTDFIDNPRELMNAVAKDGERIAREAFSNQEAPPTKSKSTPRKWADRGSPNRILAWEMANGVSVSDKTLIFRGPRQDIGRTTGELFNKIYSKYIPPNIARIGSTSGHADNFQKDHVFISTKGNKQQFNRKINSMVNNPGDDPSGAVGNLRIIDTLRLNVHGRKFLGYTQKNFLEVFERVVPQALR